MTRRLVVPWPEWFDGAPCAGLTDVFFPEDGVDVGPAKAICAGCEHRTSCLEWGLAHAHDNWAGVYGGLTLSERKGMRKGRGLDEHLASHCRHGHEYTESNTGWTARGHRRCLACKRVSGATERLVARTVAADEQRRAS